MGPGRFELITDEKAAKSPIEGSFIDGELTLGSNIGVLGGVGVARAAYGNFAHGRV